MKRAFTLILVLLISVSLITGCGNSTSTPESTVDSSVESTSVPTSESKEQSDTDAAPETADNGDDYSLVGRWSVSSAIDTNGTTYRADELASIGMTAEIVLNEDKSATLNFAGDVYTGTWSLDDDFDDLLIVTFIDEDGDEDELLLDIVGDTLELDEDGSITIFTKK